MVWGHAYSSLVLAANIVAAVSTNGIAQFTVYAHANDVTRKHQLSSMAWHAELASVAEAAAKKLGYLTLKVKQEDVIISFLKGRDVLAILPTGYGKSLCYSCLPHAFDLLSGQLGSLIVVVSPLTALIRDQVSFSFKPCFTRFDV